MIPKASHPHDAAWLNGMLGRFPPRFRGPLCRLYSRTYKAHPRFGRRNANLQLLGTAEKLPKAGASLAADDGQLVEWAGARARQARIQALKLDTAAAYAVLSAGCARLGITPPEVSEDKGRTPAGAVARMCCPLWWRRQVRKSVGRQVEGLARELFLVNKAAGIYSSDETLHRRRGQKSRNRRMLEEVQAVNELGETFTLAELAELSVSNPVIRRGELMTRIAGFEVIADKLGHVGEFITITCPSRMHRAMLAHFGGQQIGKAVDNPRFDGTTPRQAQEYLARVWARIRAKLARHGIRLYGFRVAEPNHDGCPHWHMLVFMPRWARNRVRHTFRQYGLQVDRDEPGAKQHRVTCKTIDKSRGTAAGYIAKYVAKNIDGFALDADLYGGDPNDAAERVDAWAACWGIRQFQQLGGPPVTVWRELRRLAQDVEPDALGSGPLQDAAAAADLGDWAAYVTAMGGPLAPRDGQPIRPAYWQEIDRRTGAMPASRYGEPPVGRLFGVRVGAVFHLTRWHQWEILRPGEVPEATRRSGPGPLAGGGAAGPWSSVNNCTQDWPPNQTRPGLYGDVNSGTAKPFLRTWPDNRTERYTPLHVSLFAPSEGAE